MEKFAHLNDYLPLAAEVRRAASSFDLDSLIAAATGLLRDRLGLAAAAVSLTGFAQTTPSDTGRTLTLPLKSGDTPLGDLYLRAAEGNTFAESDRPAFQALADEIAFAMGAAILHRQERARSRQMALLSQSALNLSGPQISVDLAVDLIVRRG
ncbi:MAG: hypothetical protein AAB342_02870, partial [Chloroflexota bacterium]